MYDIISSKACTFITLTPDLRHRLGKSLAGEWAPRGVRVNMVSPGYIDTDMSTGSAGGKVWSDEWMRRTPVGRFGTPKEVADMLVVMASDKTTYASLDSPYCREMLTVTLFRFMTGTDIILDGGCAPPVQRVTSGR